MNQAEQGVPARLRLRRSRGEAQDRILSIPLDGCGLAGALRLGDAHLGDPSRRAADLCRIEIREGAWVLAMDSHALVCARNGERLAGASTTRLDFGDVIEIGLLRFEFERGGDAVVPIEAPGPAAGAVQPTVAPATEPAVADRFDLRDLAREAMSAPPPIDDPFGALDIIGAHARNPGDALAELLGEKAPPVEARRYATPQPVSSAGPDASTRDSHSSSDGGAEMLTALHEEFVRVVRDPTRLAGNVNWSEFLAADREKALSKDGYLPHGAPVESVRNILDKRYTVEEAIDRIGSLGENDGLDEIVNEDVLRLFAPELAHETVAALPSLTRREHHAISPDSHLRLGLTQRTDGGDPGEGNAQD